MPQAFISYASKDAIFAELAKLKLKEAGVQVWIDQSALHAGENWRDAIDEGISSSDVLLIVITPQSCESKYVTYEWGFALGKGIKVIPLLLEDSELHPRLNILQYLDFRNPQTGPWSELVQEIGKKSAESKASQGKDPSAYVRDMTVEQLQALISGAVSLAAATAKSSGHAAAPEDISRAAKSIVDVAQQEATQNVESSTGILQRHILWVDDRPDNNIYERGAFQAMGFRFTLALSTHQALQMLADESFSAIISDMGREEGPREGYVLLDALRSKGDDTPFFIYAGSNAPQHKREAAKHGAQGSTNNPQELFELVTQSFK